MSTKSNSKTKLINMRKELIALKEKIQVIHKAEVEKNKQIKMEKQANSKGRPTYQPRFPTKNKWTFRNLCDVNGVVWITGKGKNCSKITLQKYMWRDAELKENSLIVNTGEVVKVKAGRPPELFSLRSKYVPATDTPVTVDVGTEPEQEQEQEPIIPHDVTTVNTTEEYEALKANLLAPLVTGQVAETLETTNTDDVTSTSDPISTNETVPATNETVITNS